MHRVATSESAALVTWHPQVVTRHTSRGMCCSGGCGQWGQFSGYPFCLTHSRNDTYPAWSVPTCPASSCIYWYCVFRKFWKNIGMLFSQVLIMFVFWSFRFKMVKTSIGSPETLRTLVCTCNHMWSAIMLHPSDYQCHETEEQYIYKPDAGFTLLDHLDHYHPGHHHNGRHYDSLCVYNQHHHHHHKKHCPTRRHLQVAAAVTDLMELYLDILDRLRWAIQPAQNESQNAPAQHWTAFGPGICKDDGAQ